MPKFQIPPGPYLGAPPVLPSSKVDPALGDWLHRFSLWCQGNFNSTLQKRSATGAIFMQAPGGTVWSVTVDDTGALKTTQMNPGQGP